MSGLGTSRSFHSAGVWLEGTPKWQQNSCGKVGTCLLRGIWELILPSSNIGYCLCNFALCEGWLRTEWGCGCMSAPHSCVPREGVLDSFNKKSHLLGHLQPHLPTFPCRSSSRCPTCHSDLAPYPFSMSLFPPVINKRASRKPGPLSLSQDSVAEQPFSLHLPPSLSLPSCLQCRCPLCKVTLDLCFSL